MLGAQHLLRIADFYIILGAGGNGDAGLQHVEQVETHLHVLVTRHLEGQGGSGVRSRDSVFLLSPL